MPGSGGDEPKYLEAETSFIYWKDTNKVCVARMPDSGREDWSLEREARY